MMKVQSNQVLLYRLGVIKSERVSEVNGGWYYKIGRLPRPCNIPFNCLLKMEKWRYFIDVCKGHLHSQQKNKGGP